jgi:hypothetical protein
MTESRETEGASVEPLDYAASVGVTRHLTESYSVGGYRYTNLADAVAQARRMTQRERDVL